MDSSNKSPILACQAPWKANSNEIWLASALSLHRNIEKFKFPIKLDASRREHIRSLVIQAIGAITSLKNPQVVKAEDSTPIEKEYLLEHFLISEGLPELRSGEAFIVDESGTFLAYCNVYDHIMLQYLDTSGDLEHAWVCLTALEQELAKTFTFAFSSSFGFLTSNPSLAGTGFLATAFLHVPALIDSGELPELIAKEHADSVEIMGLQGSPSEFIGDIICVRNKYTLGITEEGIIAALRNAILHIQLAEKTARSRAKEVHNVRLYDRVSRALGLLTYSQQLETKEALAALSLIKVGRELGWLQGLSVECINALFFACRRAHIMAATAEIPATESALQRRATMLRQAILPLSFVKDG